MQSTVSPSGMLLDEFFQAPTEKKLNEQMDTRLQELEGQGHTFKRRVKIGRNGICPCGSGKKFKKCCLSKIKVAWE